MNLSHKGRYLVAILLGMFLSLAPCWLVYWVVRCLNPHDADAGVLLVWGCGLCCFVAGGFASGFLVAPANHWYGPIMVCPAFYLELVFVAITSATVSGGLKSFWDPAAGFFLLVVLTVSLFSSYTGFFYWRRRSATSHII